MILEILSYFVNVIYFSNSIFIHLLQVQMQSKI